jgi:hypothetical protein
LQARFEGTQSALIADGGFETTDKYLGRIAAFRKGNRIAGFANVPDGQDAAAMAKALAERLP